jgi:hypothetical protein
MKKTKVKVIPKLDELSEILKKDEINRLDADFIIQKLYGSDYNILANSIGVNSRWLKEQLSAIKPFLKQTSDAIKLDALKKIKAN